MHERAVVVLRQFLQAHDVVIGRGGAPAALLDQARAGPARASERPRVAAAWRVRQESAREAPAGEGVRLKLAVLEEPLGAALHHNLKACTSAKAEAGQRSSGVSCGWPCGGWTARSRARALLDEGLDDGGRQGGAVLVGLGLAAQPEPDGRHGSMLTRTEWSGWASRQMQLPRVAQVDKHAPALAHMSAALWRRRRRWEGAHGAGSEGWLAGRRVGVGGAPRPHQRERRSLLPPKKKGGRVADRVSRRSPMRPVTDASWSMESPCLLWRMALELPLASVYQYQFQFQQTPRASVRGFMQPGPDLAPVVAP